MSKLQKRTKADINLKSISLDIDRYAYNEPIPLGGPQALRCDMFHFADGPRDLWRYVNVYIKNV